MRANLNAANIPLVSNLFGQSIIIPQQDQNFQRSQIVGEDAQLDKGIPQIWYGHNIVPIGQGLQSVNFRRIVAPVPGLTTFTKITTVRDAGENKAFLGITSDGGIYLFPAGASAWINISPGGWTGGNVSFATANGISYICLSGFNVYSINITSPGLTVAALIGVVGSSVIGIGSSSNYLLLHDLTTVYWSSTTNPLDFTPSLITGASSAIPNDLEGIIIGIGQLNNGFAIFTSVNIVLASFSGNTRYPWIFRGANNSSGVKNMEAVAVDGDNGSNYAWTAAGLLRVTATGCIAVFPEVTDFLAGRVFEDFDEASATFSRIITSSDFVVKLAFVGSRYLLISYGVTKLTHALVYDVPLKRWGKLRVAHVDCFELGVDATDNLVWSDPAPGVSWASYVGVAWQDMLKITNIAASPKRTMGFLQADGTIVYANFDGGDITADAVALIGKFQLLRTETVVLEEVSIENVDTNNSGNFLLRVLTSYDGKSTGAISTPYQDINSVDFRHFLSSAAGISHSLLFTGAFALTSLELTFSRHGRR